MQIKKKAFFDWHIASGCLALLLIIFSLYFISEKNRSWSQHADQEITLAYNALLANANQKQEYLDHPGFYTVQSLAQLIKLKVILGNSSIKNVDDLNAQPSLFAGFSDIVASAHLLSFIGVAILAISWYLYSRTEIHDNLASFFLSIAIFFDDAIIKHQFIQLRTELIACLLLYFSIFIFFRSVKRNHGFELFSLFISLVLLFCAALNKAQIFLFVPLYFFWAILYFRKAEESKKIVFRKKYEILIALLSILICFIFFISQSKGLSIWFNLLFLTSLNGLVCLYWRINGGNLMRQIAIFNAVYLGSYLTTRLFIYGWVGYSSDLFTQINNPMNMLYWANSLNLEAYNKGSIHWDEVSTHPSVFRLVSLAIEHILMPAKLVLLDINSQSFLFYLNLFLLLISKNTQKIIRWNVIICLILFYVILVISSFRYLSGHYFIFAQFFLIMALISQISIVKQKKLYCFLIMLIMILINQASIRSTVFDNDNNLKALCSGAYMGDWHKQLQLEKFINDCNTYGY